MHWLVDTQDWQPIITNEQCWQKAADPLNTTRLSAIQLSQVEEFEQEVQLLIVAAQEEHTLESIKYPVEQFVQSVEVQLKQSVTTALHG